MLLQTGLLLHRMIFSNIEPWEEESLDNLATQLEGEIGKLVFDEKMLRDFIIGAPLVGDDWRNDDPFGSYAVIHCDQFRAWDLLTLDEREAVRRFANAPALAGDAARRLLTIVTDNRPQTDPT
jgi:hypothetical protein